MLTFTDTARDRVQSFLENNRSQDVAALRVAGNRSEHKLWLVKAQDKQESDLVVDAGGFEVFLDPLSATNLEGATVDFVDDVMQSGFRIFHPSPTWDDPLLQRVQDILDEQVNPGIAGHGGSVAIDRFEAGTLHLIMGGGCQGCSSAQLTLRQGIEQMVKAAVPEVKRVVDATDHAAGENPYYSETSAASESPLAESQ